MTLIDSHAHLHASEFDADREQTIARARAAGVEHIILIGAGGDLQTAQSAVDLAQTEGFLWATVGVHPHDVDHVTEDWWNELERLAANPKVVGIGETGLDYFYEHGDRARQREFFARSVEMARRADKPLICHIRDAHDDAKQVLRETGANRGVIHCFTGDESDARDYLALGFYISFSGIVTFRSAEPVRRAAAMVPGDRILLETDCPYLAPIPMRGKRNEPAYLPHTAAALASLRGCEMAEIAEQTTANTHTLFALT